ncbi:hypothetical protein [Kitasatospora sp. MBT63]|uniref:hypothetical protein n=1 Tax=Kitasatospora sp. MBT63 TaxID=1444768 RepID=UPI0013142000|nr:hypothetical protein [Kitasatospora sp. MBT63]
MATIRRRIGSADTAAQDSPGRRAAHARAPAAVPRIATPTAGTVTAHAPRSTHHSK